MMKNPAHPGGLIRDNIEELGLSVAEAAKGLGVTRQQLYRLINGHHGLTPEMALRLEQAFGGSADAWMRMQIAYDLRAGAGARERFHCSARAEGGVNSSGSARSHARTR
ncbi:MULTISPECIES: HigA family addiction module antitoxin [unclassified Methylosinus]|uniref:HigA family addiction module antitoxin n=1 Tax=unclassified Methylosinus TaxID=2624500 RepID=UPI0004655A63|nr:MULTISPECIES: HigA family addiction module antitoxin [unclassified Methylosinus]